MTECLPLSKTSRTKSDVSRLFKNAGMAPICGWGRGSSGAEVAGDCWCGRKGVDYEEQAWPEPEHRGISLWSRVGLGCPGPQEPASVSRQLLASHPPYTYRFQGPESPWQVPAGHLQYV